MKISASAFWLCTLVYPCLAGSAGWADVIETTSGSVLRGKVLASEGGVIQFETDFAGLLAIKQDQIKAITTDGALFVALKDGAIVQGRVAPAAPGLTITTSGGPLSADVPTIAAVWREGDKSPAERAAEALAPHWVYQLAFDLNSKNGWHQRSFFPRIQRPGRNADTQRPPDFHCQLRARG